MSPQPVLNIEVVGHNAVLPAELAPQVLTLLEYRGKRWVADRRLGYRPEERHLRFWRVEDDRLWFRAGLVPRVQRHLAAQGYAVQVSNLTPWWHLSRAHHKLLMCEDWNRPERKLLEALSQNERGQILVSDEGSLAAAAALFCSYYAYEDILIVAKNRDRADWLAAALSRQTERIIDLEYGEAKHRRPRALVVTSQCAATLGGEDFRLLLFADLESALHEANDPLPRPPGLNAEPDYRISLHNRWRTSTFYAICDTHRRITSTEELRLEALFGPVIFGPTQEQSPSGIAVTFVPDTLAPERNGRAPALDCKRHLYWHHEEWNRQISEIAQRAVAGELPIDQTAGIEIASDASVRVLVESSEHGLALQQELPEWTLLTLCAPEKTTPAQPHCIVTMSHAVENGLHSDIIVRADGGQGWPLTGVLEGAEALVTSRLVVDFEDRRNKHCATNTESRIAAYARGGWVLLPHAPTPVGVPSMSVADPELEAQTLDTVSTR